MFSPEELAWLEDPTWFPRKRQLIERVGRELESLRDLLCSSPEIAAIDWPDGTDVQTGKLSRGENYHGQPWIMLDFPRFFHREGIAAFRTLFHWGHGVQVSLHLSEAGLTPFRDNLQEQGPGWWIDQSKQTWVDPGESNDPLDYRITQQGWTQNPDWTKAKLASHWRINTPIALDLETKWVSKAFNTYTCYGTLLNRANAIDTRHMT